MKVTLIFFDLLRSVIRSDKYFILPQIIVYILTSIKIEIKRLYIFFPQKGSYSGYTLDILWILRDPEEALNIYH